MDAFRESLSGAKPDAVATEASPDCMDEAAILKLFRKHAKYISQCDRTKVVDKDNTSVALEGSPVKISVPNSVLDSYQTLIQQSLELLVDGNDEGSLASILLECIKACNMDVRGSVVSNILISGEGASIKGLPHTLTFYVFNSLYY